MTTLNISLPDSMRVFIDEQVKQKATVPKRDYIRHLIGQEQEREEHKRLKVLLLEGLESGEPIEISNEWWKNKRSQLLQRFRSEKS